jgi:hypothetical protein
MIPARRARTALETGTNDCGYRVSGWPAETLTLLPRVMLAIPATVTRRRQNFTVA